MHAKRLHQLFDKLSAALVLYARQWCEYPDDAVQEAFIDLANCSDEPESPKAWLYTTTRRKAQNIARSENRRRHHQQQASEAAASWFSRSSANVLLAEDVIHGLETLASDERELVVARIWGELNFEQLASLLGCSVSSAHRRYNAALAKLKLFVNQDNPSDEREHSQPTHSPLQSTPRSDSSRRNSTPKDAGDHPNTIANRVSKTIENHYE